MSDNLLQSIDFSFSIRRLPQTNYFIQRANIPGLQLGEVIQPNRFGGNIFHHGDKLTHEEFNVTFKVDEGMENWFEIYAWMVGLAAPHAAEQYTNLQNSQEGLYSDATLIIMSSQKNPLHQFTFKNLFPKMLTGIDLDATQTSMAYMNATATFQFDYFDYKKIV